MSQNWTSERIIRRFKTVWISQKSRLKSYGLFVLTKVYSSQQKRPSLKNVCMRRHFVHRNSFDWKLIFQLKICPTMTKSIFVTFLISSLSINYNPFLSYFKYVSNFLILITTTEKEDRGVDFSCLFHWATKQLFQIDAWF